jgi:hypothetical protein
MAPLHGEQEILLLDGFGNPGTIYRLDSEARGM